MEPALYTLTAETEFLLYKMPGMEAHLPTLLPSLYMYTHMCKLISTHMCTQTYMDIILKNMHTHAFTQKSIWNLVVQCATKCFNAVRYFAKASIGEFVYFPTFCHCRSSMVLFTHVFFYNSLNISLMCRL